MHDRKYEYSKALINGHNMSALEDHVKSTGHSLKWDHFEILARGLSDSHCRINDTLLIKDLKASLKVFHSFHSFIHQVFKAASL